MGQKFYCYIFEKFVYSLCLNGGVEITLFYEKGFCPQQCTTDKLFFISADTNKAQWSQFPYQPILIPIRHFPHWQNQYIGQYRYHTETILPVHWPLVKWCERHWKSFAWNWLYLKFYDISKNLFMNDLIAALNSMHFFSFFIDILFMIFHIQIFFILNVWFTTYNFTRWDLISEHT